MKKPDEQELVALTDTKALAFGEIVVGYIQKLDECGQAEVAFSIHGQSQKHSAMSSVPVLSKDVGRQVALAFVSGDIQQPMIIGYIHNALDSMLENYQQGHATLEGSDKQAEQDEALFTAPIEHSEAKVSTLTASAAQTNVDLDGRKVCLTGSEEIVLKCGESSITLTKDGKILVRGKYILNRSTGINRIMGGSVQVN